jgi:hypothetical protein
VPSAKGQEPQDQDQDSQAGQVSHTDGSVAEQASARAEQQNLIGLAYKVLASWPATWRVVCVLTVLVSLVAALLWLVPMDIEIGQVKVSPH